MLTRFANGQWFNLADMRKVVSGTSPDGTQHYVDIGIIPAAFFPTREDADAERDRIAALVNAKQCKDTVLDIKRVRNQLREVKQIANEIQNMRRAGVSVIFTYMQLLATGMLNLFTVLDSMLPDEQQAEPDFFRQAVPNPESNQGLRNI